MSIKIDSLFCMLLFLLFLGLKLTGFIDWSWIYVFAPLYGPLLVVSAFIFAFVIFKVFIAMCERSLTGGTNG